jgi:toxin YoeB
MKIVFSSQAWEDYLHWQRTDRKMIKRINDLIREVTRTPFQGTGKPEPLQHALAGCWSRRINEEHRLVYKIDQDSVFIVQARYHY